MAEGSNNEFKNLQENEGKSVLLKSWKAEACPVIPVLPGLITIIALFL